jgi:hypothetical protein
MSYLPSFGPAPFSINVVNDGKARCILLTPKTTPPNGTYTLSVGHPPVDGDCSKTSDFTARGTVVLDQSGKLLSFSPLHGTPIGGHAWKHMTGVFNSDGTGGGEIDDDSQPHIIISGTWAAGGGGEPFGHHHDQKHGQQA